jgi:hypothetical protein
MAQEQLDFEGTQWLKELRAALGEELVDVRCVREGEGYDFILVYSPGNDRASLERFVEAFNRAPDIPPFDLMSFEAGRVPHYYDEYKSISVAPAHAQ